MLKIQTSPCPKDKTRVHLRIWDGPADNLRLCGHLCVELETWLFLERECAGQDFVIPPKKEQSDEDSMQVPTD